MEHNLEEVPAEGFPALYGHCLTIWEAMFEKATPYGEDNEYRLYEGFLTRLFKESNLSVPYYTNVMNTMKKMGCVQQIKRGGGAGASQWLLMTEPTYERFQTAHDALVRGGSVRSSKRDMVAQQLRDLGQRVSDLEDQVQELVEATS